MYGEVPQSYRPRAAEIRGITSFAPRFWLARRVPNHWLQDMNSTAAGSSEIAAPLIDRDAALASVGDDLDLLREIGALFINDSSADLADLRNCVLERNAYRIERTAHRLKGSIGAFGRGPVFQAASRIQESGRKKDLSNVDADLLELDCLLSRLCAEIRVLISL